MRTTMDDKMDDETLRGRGRGGGRDTRRMQEMNRGWRLRDRISSSRHVRHARPTGCPTGMSDRLPHMHRVVERRATTVGYKDTSPVPARASQRS